MSRKVSIPFKPRFEKPMLSGQKTMTSRTTKMAQVDDTFRSFGATFVVLDVWQATLNSMALHYWKEEGCSSMQDFINIWTEIHPRKGFDPEQTVWAHQFKRTND